MARLLLGFRMPSMNIPASKSLSARNVPMKAITTINQLMDYFNAIAYSQASERNSATNQRINKI
jgi:hypothetical protein